jgi:hypothetical protein
MTSPTTNTSNELSPKEKRRLTVLKKYGVENVAHIPEFQRRKKISNLQKYGVDNVAHVPEFREKAKATNLAKYGEEYPAHTEKSITTSLRRYGVRHPMQNFRVFQRVMSARFKIKSFEAESGTIFKYQGYEDVVIKFLLNEMGICEDRIITSRASIPKIFYNHPETKRISRYYPDIWIKGTNLMIEVKSRFTLQFKPEVIREKIEECQRRGFICIVVVCDKKNVLDFFI